MTSGRGTAAEQSQALAYSVIEPHFEAVRDVFLGWERGQLAKLGRVKLAVSPDVRDSARHFAACRDDGLLIELAPQAANLPVETLTAIIAHEFGHAADFAFPAQWRVARSGEAEWSHDVAGKGSARLLKQWAARDDDRVETDADAIARAVTGKSIGYCGPCKLQCFSGAPRPKGLR